MTKPNQVDAIESLAPGALFSYGHGPGSRKYEAGDRLVWDSSDITQPTDSAIAAETTRLQTEYDNNKYQRDRAAAYPSVGDQLDMQYWDKKNGTTTWVDAVAKVKSDNPKS